MQTAALYIHFPFCTNKCIYCDFYSITDQSWQKRFLSALAAEIELAKTTPPFEGFVFSTIFFGGGTPSLMSAEEISFILSLLKSRLLFADDIEVTCEVNPGTLTRNKSKAFRAAGINRLSIGVQSFQDDELRALTRIHNAHTAHQSVQYARQAGFDNISIDLIFGIQGQTLASWRQTLAAAVQLRPQHISMYGLTVEPDTPLHRLIGKGKMQKCDEELEREMYLLGKETLEAAGYEHYEISNFALPGYRCRHNEKYWDASPYLSLGPSAHSFDGVHRWQNVRDVKAYCEKLESGQPAIAAKENLTRQQRELELILLGLRRREGLSLTTWQDIAGNDFLQISKTVINDLGGYDERARPFAPSDKLLGLTRDTLFLTREGLLLYDSICNHFASIVNNVT